MENESLWGDAEQPISAPVEPQESPAALEQLEQPTKPTPQESFQEIRLRNERLQRERDEAVLTLKRIEEYALQQQQQAPQKEKDPEPAYDDDDYVEARHFKNKIHDLENRLQQVQQYNHLSTVEMQLRNKYSDFDKVMTHENVSKLREIRPEIASSLHQSTDVYNKASATYTILKELGIYKEDIYNPDKDRVEYNNHKPRVASSLKKTESALSHVTEFSGSRLTEDRKRQIYAQMIKNIQ